MPEGSTAERESVARPAARVSLATAASRVGGVLREIIFAALLGAGGDASAFFLAFRIPNLLRDFFAEGALASAFVPTFAHLKSKEGDERALLLARRVLGTLLVITGGIALLGMIFAPLVVSVIAPGASAEQRPLIIHLTRIMFPFLPLVSAAAVAMGVLNTHRRFFIPALAPAFFNVVAVTGGLVMLALRWDRPERFWWAVTGWAVLIVLGGAAQILIQLPSLRRVGWHGMPLPDLRFRDPALRAIVRRMAPVVISLAGVNVMLVIVSALSSFNDHWPSWLNYSFRLIHLPIGIVGVAVGTVLLAIGSTTAAEGNARALDDLVRRGLRLNWFLSLPAAVGLAVVGEPIIRMLFLRGRFQPADVPATAAALQYYAVGVVFYAGIRAAAALFLARGNTRTPMLCSLGGIVVTSVLALALVGPLEHCGLALAVALGSSTNFLLLRGWGRRAFGRGSAVEGSFLLRVGAAAGLMGVVGHLAARAWLIGDQAVASRWGHAAATLGLIGGLALLYFVATSALGVAEAAWLRGRLRPRRPH